MDNFSNYNVTGSNIKRIRIKHGYSSLRKLCDALEKRGFILDASNLNKIEKGERQVTDILINEIHKLTGEEFSEFFRNV